MICFLSESKPRVIFETDVKTLCLLRHLFDGNRQYLWQPASLKECGVGTFLGHEIIIVEEKCLRIRYLFKDGTSNHTDFKLPKEVEDG